MIGQRVSTNFFYLISVFQTLPVMQIGFGNGVFTAITSPFRPKNFQLFQLDGPIRRASDLYNSFGIEEGGRLRHFGNYIFRDRRWYGGVDSPRTRRPRRRRPRKGWSKSPYEKPLYHYPMTEDLNSFIPIPHFPKENPIEEYQSHVAQRPYFLRDFHGANIRPRFPSEELTSHQQHDQGKDDGKSAFPQQHNLEEEDDDEESYTGCDIPPSPNKDGGGLEEEDKGRREPTEEEIPPHLATVQIEPIQDIPTLEPINMPEIEDDDHFEMLFPQIFSEPEMQKGIKLVPYSRKPYMKGTTPATIPYFTSTASSAIHTTSLPETISSAPHMNSSSPYTTSSSPHTTSSSLDTPSSSLDTPSSSLDTTTASLDTTSSALDTISSALDTTSSALDTSPSSPDTTTFASATTPSITYTSLAIPDTTPSVEQEIITPPPNLAVTTPLDLAPSASVEVRKEDEFKGALLDELIHRLKTLQTVPLRRQWTEEEVKRRQIDILKLAIRKLLINH